MNAVLNRLRLSTLRPPVWSWVAVAALISTLLLALGFVVQSGVRDGAARNADVAAQTDAAWRCQVGRDRPGRQDCVQKAREALSASR